jgi:hypothetical protein
MLNKHHQPICIGRKPNFPCKICRVYHLNIFFPPIVVVGRVWHLSKGSSSSELYSVSQQTIQSFVDEVVFSMQSSPNTTLILGGDASLYRVVSHHFQQVVD